MVKKSARRTRRTHTPAFKARLALAALREDKTKAELCKQFELHPSQITEWNRQLPESAANVFGGATAQEEPVDLVPLHAQIGQLMLENDFLEHALTKVPLRAAVFPTSSTPRAASSRLMTSPKGYWPRAAS